MYCSIYTVVYICANKSFLRRGRKVNSVQLIHLVRKAVCTYAISPFHSPNDHLLKPFLDGLSLKLLKTVPTNL